MLEDHITSGDTSIDLEDLSHHVAALASKCQNKVFLSKTFQCFLTVLIFELLTLYDLVLFNIFLFPKTHDINDHDGPLNGKKYNGSFEDEYQKICSLRPRYTIGDCAAGIT